MDFLQVIMPSLLSFVGTVVAVLFGYLGVKVKQLYNKYVDTQVEKDVVDSTVKYVEQIYTDIHGEDKLNEALKQASSILQEKGIQVSQDQLKTLIESAVYGMNQGIKDGE
ncbi:MAG: phage holin, LLH family [Faecalicoccus sp.]|uniref:phage holin, LLH family n=2 Tax=Faecalicoccus sp. TaxID=1971758 RepID=UPI002A7FDDD5|nr:phage holin, LLH family [Faecalicoccus sp.]MCI6379587.1 phage holin family protein [Erysipelotrichaceae bacterium]MDY4870480.1 phage holin, LLH family [Faecalicoccus sp.]